MQCQLKSYSEHMISKDTHPPPWHTENRLEMDNMVNNMTIALLGSHDPQVPYQETRQVEGKPRAFRREIGTNTHEDLKLVLTLMK